MLAFCVSSCQKVETSLVQTRDTPEFNMIMEIVPAERIQSVCAALGVQYTANACNSFNLDTNTCHIYVAPQRHAHDEERLALIGHEVWHCRYGKWHE